MKLPPIELLGRHICLCLLVAVSIVEAQHAMAEITDSGLDYFEASQRILWLDDHQVVAMLGEKDAHAIRDRHKANKQSIYHWDISSNSIKKIAGPAVSGLCVSNGYIGYEVFSPADEGRSSLKDYFGPFGAETLQPDERVRYPRDRYTCRRATPEKMPQWMLTAKKQGRIFVALREEHGWLEIGQRSDVPVGQRWFLDQIFTPDSTPNQGKMIEREFAELLHSSGFHVSPPEASYIAAKNAYAISLRKNDRSLFGGDGAIDLDRIYRAKPEDEAYLWLHPDGRVERMKFFNPSTMLRGRKIFTGKFLALLRLNHVDVDDPNQGIFVDAPTGVLQVVSGYTSDHSTSPNGCKIAFGRGKISDGVGWQYRLAVVDLCKTKMGQLQIGF